jgi:hypothetical protein
VQSDLQNQQIIQLTIGIGGSSAAQLRVTIHSALREDLVLENLALRRQLLALHAQQPRRRLTALHKLFWVALRTFWSGWTKPLLKTQLADN